MSAVTIQEASRRDLDGMIELLRVLFLIEQDFHFEEDKQRRGLLMLLESGEALVLTATHGTQVIGMCSAQRTISTAEGGYSLVLEDLVVRQSFRGRGVAESLLEGVAEWGARNRVLRFQLLADRSNHAALRFYQRRGWRTTNLVSLMKLPTGGLIKTEKRP